MNRLTPLVFVPLCLVSFAACSDEQAPVDGADDTFLIDGKADSIGIAPTDDELCAILKLVTLGDEDVLDDDARLHKKAVANILDYRDGDDDDFADDDIRLTSLAELDRIKYVGPAAFKQLLAFVRSEDGAAFACADVAVQLLSFNDYHGAMAPPSGSGGVILTDPTTTPPTTVPAGGAEYLATHIAELEKTNPNTLVVAAGDCIGATPLLSAAFHDEPTVESLDALGLDISSVGNHEFDEGIEELWRMQYGGNHPDAPTKGYDGDGEYEGARYTYLAANVTSDEDGETVFPAFTVRRFGNAWIAFIGMTLEGTPNVVTAFGVQGLKFHDEVTTANALVPQIQALGIETIVVLVHEGGFASALYDQCNGVSGPIVDIVDGLDDAIDVVISGHTNGAYVCERNGKLLTSAAHNGRLVSDIDLVIDERTGDVKSMVADNVIVTRTVEKNKVQTDIISKWEKLVAPIANRVVGTIKADIKRTPNPAGESPLGDVIADGQLAASSGARIAFMNPGGIRTDLTFAQSVGGGADGQVTYGELFAVQPFSNNLVLMDLTGAQIEALLEQQFARATPPMFLQVSRGFSYRWDPARPAGDKVDAKTITLDGVPLDPTANYRVVCNVFLSDGGDGFPEFKKGTNKVSGVFDLEAFEAYLVANQNLDAPALNRILSP